MTTNEQTKTPLEQLREMVAGAQVRDGRLSFGEDEGFATVLASTPRVSGLIFLVCEAPDSGTIERMKEAAASHGLDITWPKTVKSTHEVWSNERGWSRALGTELYWRRGRGLCSPAGTLTLYDDGSYDVEWKEEEDAQTKGQSDGAKAYHVVVDEAQDITLDWDGFAEFLGSCAHAAPMKKTREGVGEKADAAGLALALAVEWTCASCSQPFNAYRKEVPDEKKSGLCADCYLGWGGNGSVMRPLDKRIDDSRRERAPVETAWSTPGYGDDPMGGV